MSQSKIGTSHLNKEFAHREDKQSGDAAISNHLEIHSQMNRAYGTIRMKGYATPRNEFRGYNIEHPLCGFKIRCNF